jgi:hypothetical protein
MGRPIDFSKVVKIEREKILEILKHCRLFDPTIDCDYHRYFLADQSEWAFLPGMDVKNRPCLYCHRGSKK